MVWCGVVCGVVCEGFLYMYEIWILSAIMNFLLQFLLLLSVLNAFIIAISNFFFILVVKHLRNVQDNSLVCKITHLLNTSEMLLSKTSHLGRSHPPSFGNIDVQIFGYTLQASCLHCFWLIYCIVHLCISITTSICLYSHLFWMQDTTHPPSSTYHGYSVQN